MKQMKSIILWILGIFAGIFGILFIMVAVFGKTFVISQIEKNLKMKASIESIHLGFPLSVTLTKLELGKLATIDRLSIYPSLLGFFTGRVVLNNVTVIHPVVTLEQSSDGKLNLPQPEQKGGSSPVLLAGLTVKEGMLTFRDRKVSEQGYEIMLDEFNIDMKKASVLPTSLKAKFTMSARLVDTKNKPAGTFNFSGWIDFGPKDMDGQLKIKDVEITTFSPYYGNFISGKKLISGKLNFNSNIKARNNDLTALCHLELGSLDYEKKPVEEGSTSVPDIFPSALDFFADAQGNIKLDFPIRTKLDNPALDAKTLQKAVMNAALKSLSNKSPEKIKGNISDVIDQFKKLKENYKDIFKKKNDQPPQETQPPPSNPPQQQLPPEQKQGAQ